MKLVTLSLLVLLTLPASLVAQDTSKLRFRAVCFDPRETANPTFHIATGGGERKEIEIGKSTLCGPFEAILRDGHHLDFFAQGDSETPATTVSFRTLPSAPILVVFAPRQNSYHAFSIELPPDRFRRGSTLLVNASDAEIGVHHGKTTPIRIPPGKHGVVAPPKGFNEPMLPVQIYEKGDGDDDWRIVQSTRWPIDSRFRSYLFLYRQPDTKRIKMHGIPERMDAPPEEP